MKREHIGDEYFHVLGENFNDTIFKKKKLISNTTQNN